MYYCEKKKQLLAASITLTQSCHSRDPELTMVIITVFEPLSTSVPSVMSTTFTEKCSLLFTSSFMVILIPKQTSDAPTKNVTFLLMGTKPRSSG